MFCPGSLYMLLQRRRRAAKIDATILGQSGI